MEKKFAKRLQSVQMFSTQKVLFRFKNFYKLKSRSIGKNLKKKEAKKIVRIFSKFSSIVSV